MTKSKVAIILVIIVTLIIIKIVSMLNSEYMCYPHKNEDGFMLRTGFEVIEDYNNDIKYEEIHIID